MPIEFADIIYQLEVLGVALVILTFCLMGLMALGYVLFIFWKYRDREKHSMEYALIQVATPRDNETKIDAAEQMFASLHAIHHGGFWSFLKPQDHISCEIVAKREDIRFYIAAPKRYIDLVEKQVHGSYPGADVKIVDEYNIFSENGKVAFAALTPKNSDYLPIRVFRDLPIDPLSSITSNLAKMAEGEGAAIQLLIQPAGSKWASLGRSYISKTKKNEANPEKANFKVDAKTLESIEQKVSKPGFNAVIRIVVNASTKEVADAHLENLVTSFHQFTSDHNHFSKVKHPMKKFFMIDFIYRYFPIVNLPFFKQHGVLNSDELASIYHFPNKSVETPHIFWLNAKRAPAPMQIASSGLYIGVSRYRGVDRPIFIGDDDRRRHLYIIGKTGTGKSQLLEELVIQDIKAGKGLAVIDPHGDLIDGVLARIPPERAEDVIYFDPSDSERPMGINMLEAGTEQQKHFVVTGIVGLMYKLYDPQKTGIIGPRFEHAVRNAMLTVMSEPGTTFIEVVR